jgi:hypothetical protein
LPTCSKTQGTAELLLAVPDLEEKPNFTKKTLTQRLNSAKMSYKCKQIFFIEILAK